MLGRELKRRIYWLVGWDLNKIEPEMDIHYIGGTDVLPPPLEVDVENEMLEAIVKKFENEIMKETLTEKVVYNTQRNSYTEVTINGEKLMLDVEVI